MEVGGRVDTTRGGGPKLIGYSRVGVLFVTILIYIAHGIWWVKR